MITKVHKELNYVKPQILWANVWF